MSVLVTISLLGGATLLILGGLVGHSLSQQVLDGRLREQAALQRRIGEQWRALVALRRTSGRCPECGARCFFDDGPADPDEPLR